MPQAILKIKGRVQGVFFRDNAKKEAKKLGIKGFVKNMENDTVLIHAQGEKEQLSRFIEWCKKGPEPAKVENIEITWNGNTENFESFEILY